MTLTEKFIREAIQLDSNAEVIYGSDEIFDTYSLFCVSYAACGGFVDHGLYGQRCEVFCDFAANLFLEEILMAKKKNSVQKLIGFEKFTKYGVKTDKSEFVFFHVEPTNISVLSPESVGSKIHHLTALLSLEPELEIIALDSCECFDSNKSYVRKRLEIEENEAVRELLAADLEFLDDIQIGMSSAREFMFCIRFRREKEEQVFELVNRVGKIISDHGFMPRRMKKSELKRMLGLYFGATMYGEEIPDFEGETSVTLDPVHAQEC